MPAKPTKREAATAGRAFIRYYDAGNRTTQADLLMSLGRRFEFPEGTPKFSGPWRATAVASFIEEHAKEIE